MIDNNTEIIEITPETKDLLKKNYFFVNKAQFPSYFAGSVLMAYLFMGLAIFVVIYFERVVWTYLFATLLVVIAFIYTFKWVKPYYAQKQKYAMRPTHNQIENWFVEDLRDIIKPAATEMLSLNPATITPENFIIIPHPIYWKVGGVPDEHITFYNTGEYKVYATHKIQVLALSENYISFYNCTFDWLNKEIVSPYTLEFFFDDISSIRAASKELGYIRVDSKPKELEKAEETPETEDDEELRVGACQTVVIKNKSGESIDVIVTIPELESSPRIALKPEKVMQTLRIMLRHRRYGEEFEIIRPPEEDKIDE